MINVSVERVVDLINETNSISLDPAGVKFDNPADREDGRSNVRLTAKPYAGDATVNYQRLGLDHLFSFMTPVIRVDESEGILTPEQVIARVKAQYPIDLQLEETTVTHEELPEGTVYVVTAKENSLVYKSSVTFGTRPLTQTPISDFIIADTVSYVYPNNSTNKAYARIYSGGWYLPECSIELNKLRLGEMADDNLTWLTTITSGNSWVLDEENPALYNLGGAKVVYNGPVENINLHPDDGLMLYRFPEATRVCLIELSDTLCSGLVGKLTYYYGDI